VLEAEALSDTGFQLGAGLYLGLAGQHHGSWRGALHVEGEHVADCSDPATVERIHQFRDCMIRVRDVASRLRQLPDVRVGCLARVGRRTLDARYSSHTLTV